MIKHYFKGAWRSLWKGKTTAVLNIAGLSVGMSAATLIFLWVQNELNFDNYHKDSNSIYRLTTNLKATGWVWETTPLLLSDVVKKEVPGVENSARLYSGNAPVFTINNTLRSQKNSAYVDDSWFTIFHYDFVEGNASAFSNDPNSIILTTSAAKIYFGNEPVLGKVIHADSMNYVIKGIIKDAPVNSSFQYDCFIPLVNLLKDADRKANDEQWQNANYLTFVRLKPGTDQLLVSKKITTIFERKSGDNETSVSLTALADMHFENEISNSVFVHGNKNAVYIFIVLAALLLLIACINYVNLTTAKSGLRAKEVSIRKMVGANRSGIFYQFVSEALLVSFISLAITLILIHLCLPAFNSLTGKNFELQLTSRTMWQVIGITLLSAFLLNSIYPALVLSSFRPLNVFRGFTVLKVKDSHFRKALVILQFAISVVLIIGSIVIYRQLKFIQEADPGYNKSQVLSFRLPPSTAYADKNALMRGIREDLLSQSSITNVALSNQSVINIGSYSTGNADWDGHDTTFNPKIAQFSTDADFKNTMQLQMKEGRWFKQDYVADKNNVVLNEEAVKELNIHTPVIGQRFSFKGRTGQVIGIVKNFKYKSMHEKSGPLIAFNDPKWFQLFTVRVVPGNIPQAINALQNTWKKFLPGSPLEYYFLDNTFDELYKDDQQVSSLIFIFAILAITISCLGLFSLAAFTAEQKAKEIGIRKVLGASITGITSLLTRDFLKLVILSIIIASPLAWLAMNAWLQDFAYRINISWWMFIAAGLLAVIIALVTISFQAIKAAAANPVKSLRTE